MPKLSSNPAAYSDVVTVLDLALEKPGLIYRLPTHGQAINFRQRCHRYLNILREQQAEVSPIPGFRAETPYDNIAIKQLDSDGKPSNKGRNLKFEQRALHGELIDPESGEVVPLGNASPTIGEAS